MGMERSRAAAESGDGARKGGVEDALPPHLRPPQIAPGPAPPRAGAARTPGCVFRSFSVGVNESWKPFSLSFHLFFGGRGGILFVRVLLRK